MKSLVSALLCALLIGCGGGGSSSDASPVAASDGLPGASSNASADTPPSTSPEAVSDDATPRVVFGNVVDAVTGSPLGDVEVALADGSGTVASSGGSGRFVFRLPDEATDAAVLTFSRDGYREASYADPGGDGVADLEEIALVPNDNAGTGGLSGRIDGAGGRPMVGAIVRFLAGINVREGEALASTTTAADGTWEVVDLPYGNYTCIILVDGEEPVYRTVQVFGGVERTDQNVGISGTGTDSGLLVHVIPFSAIPPRFDRDAFVAGESSWSFPRYGWTANSGTQFIYESDRAGTLGLSRTLAQLDPDSGPWANGGLGISYTFAGAGSYRIVGSYDEVQEAALAGERVARITVNADNTPPLVGRKNYLVRYRSRTDTPHSSIEAEIDELGRYRFFTSTPITVYREPPSTLHPPDAEAELPLTITNAFLP